MVLYIKKFEEYLLECNSLYCVIMSWTFRWNIILLPAGSKRKPERRKQLSSGGPREENPDSDVDW
jgi:hypothetical protein